MNSLDGGLEARGRGERGRGERGRGERGLGERGLGWMARRERTRIDRPGRPGVEEVVHAGPARTGALRPCACEREGRGGRGVLRRRGGRGLDPTTVESLALLIRWIKLTLNSGYKLLPHESRLPGALPCVGLRRPQPAERSRAGPPLPSPGGLCVGPSRRAGVPPQREESRSCVVRHL